MNSNIFDSIEGLTEVDPESIKEFEKEMEEKTIPAIIKIVDERNRLAQISRRWIIL